MTVEARPPSDLATTSPAWPWLLLALAWIILVRVPLLVHAAEHLDSDLAVDGLTLINALHGHWAWHYPGTPHIGTPPVLLSIAPALVWGPTPAVLVWAGAACYLLLTLATYFLAKAAFGPGVALWSLVPLAFASTGLVWLSARVTGGHLAGAAWGGLVVLLACQAIARPTLVRAAVFGLACGLGLYVDRIVAPTVLMALALGVAWILAGDGPRPYQRAAALVLGAAVGYIPAVAAERADPYDAYGSQFQSILTTERAGAPVPQEQEVVVQLAREHSLILAADCLPRLLAGYRLPGFETDPHPSALGGRPERPHRPAPASPLAILTTVLAGLLAAGSLIFLLFGRAPAESPDRGASGLARAIVVSASLLVLAAFVMNLHIYNSDNYRYLVPLIVPWALGAGLCLERLARQGRGGTAVAGAIALGLALLMTFSTLAWYDRFGWLDHSGPRTDPTLVWLEEHPEIAAIFADYWDAYRLAFLSGGRLTGIPYPVYPQRFPEESARFTGGRPATLLARPSGAGAFYIRQAESSKAKLLHDDRGLRIYDWPTGAQP